MALHLDPKADARLIEMIDKNVQVDWFDSVHEFVAIAEKKVSASNKYRDKFCHENGQEGQRLFKDWYGGETWGDALALAAKGYPMHVAAAETLIQKIEDSGILSAGYKGFSQSVAGIFPNVPAAIIGAPESMFDRAEDRTDGSPLRVFLDTGVSNLIDVPTILKRGVAVAAFVLGIASKRPVELYGVSALAADPNKRGPESGAVYICYRIDTRPLDLAALAYVMCSPGLWRRITFAWANQYGFERSFPYRNIGPHAPRYEAALRRALQLERSDVFIPGLTYQSHMYDDGPKWVSEMLSIHLIENQNSED